MDKWAEIAGLVNTIEESRKKLVEILENLEFEQDFHDNTPFFYGTHESHYIEVVGGKLYVSTYHHRTLRWSRMVVGNLDLELLFIMGQELLARREKLRLKGEVRRCQNTMPRCLREAKAVLVVNGRVHVRLLCPQHLEEIIKWAATEYPSTEYRVYKLNGDVIASGYAKDLSRRLHAIMEAVNSAAGGV
jgi:hypothetical protein